MEGSSEPPEPPVRPVKSFTIESIIGRTSAPPPRAPPELYRGLYFPLELCGSGAWLSPLRDMLSASESPGDDEDESPRASDSDSGSEASFDCSSATDLTRGAKGHNGIISLQLLDVRLPFVDRCYVLQSYILNGPIF